MVPVRHAPTTAGRAAPDPRAAAGRRNRFTPFLAIDPAPDPSPGERDPEECCLTIHRVPLSRLDELLFGDDVLLPSVVTAQLALKELRKRGLLPAA